MVDEKEVAPAEPITPEENKEPSEKAGEVPVIDEKSTKVAFLKQFRGLNVKEKGPKTGIAEAKLLTQEEATEKVYQKIVEIKSSDYWIFRIKKKRVLVILGFLLGAIWMFLIGQKLWQMYGGAVSFQNGMIVIQHETTFEPLPTELKEVDGPLVRIRNTQLDSGEADELVALLAEEGFVNVEIVPDTESTLSGISIVTKPDMEALRTELSILLESDYALSSPAAKLTEDSDFDVVIFYGIDAKK
jgi:hypothetical protein